MNSTALSMKLCVAVYQLREPFAQPTVVPDLMDDFDACSHRRTVCHMCRHEWETDYDVIGYADSVFVVPVSPIN